MMTKEALIAFEENIACLYRAGRIRSPVHLANGNEDELIAIFQDIKPNDWVCCAWRSHYHCLLKGVPPTELLAAIMEGRSIALCFQEHRVISSAIVGGVCPIAVGLAMGEKMNCTKNRVFCFVGDMTAETGIFHESTRYAGRNNLPIRWIVEDNGMSVGTPTDEAWGKCTVPARIERYHYKSKYPHVGIGSNVF